MSLNTQSLQPIINFIWSVADDILINKFLENQYQDVILPMTVLRRLDLALEPTKDKTLKTFHEFKNKIDNLSGLLTSEQHGTGLAFYNTSPYTMKKLLADPKNINANFLDYLNGFSENVQDIITKFKFRNQLQTFEDTGITFSLLEKFCNPKLELSPEKISPMAMGYMFEDLIRRFNEKTNAAAGRHFTPREIIELMTHLVYLPVKDKIQKGTFLVYDPCAGSGAMLTQSKLFATDPEGEIKSTATFHLYGQENTGEMYATCKSDMLLKGEDPDKIKFGSTLSEYGFDNDLKFNFMLTNPPYGTTWKQDIDNLNVGTGKKVEINDTRGETPIDLAQGILDNIDMDSYRLQLEATTNIAMEQGEDLKPIPTDMRGSTNQPEIDRLSNILQTFNDRYGTQFENADKVRQMAENIANDVAKNIELISSIQHSDDQNARITSDKVVGEELLKHITTNFDLYKLYSDNKEFKEDFSAMMFGVVKELINRGINAQK